MPGITVQLVPGADEAAVKRFAAAQQLMRHAPDYECVVHLTAEGCSVGHVAYPEYPVEVIRTAKYTVCVEGKILPISDAPLNDDLARLAQAVLGEEQVVDRIVRDWILAHEGDYFIVLVANDGKRLCAITDPLGRLPVYFAASEAGLWLGRECKFLLAAKGDVAFDRMGWAEQLWLGYPLGERTLFEGVKRACGGLLLLSRIESGRVKSAWRSLWTLNCEEKGMPHRPLREYAAELVESFVGSVRRGGETARGPIVLSLSGGRDSRAVAAALDRTGRQWIATTRMNADGRNRADVEIARRIAETLGVPWHLIELGPTAADDARRLVCLKDGLNYSGMSFILAYLERVSGQWGRATTYVTGDGGDKVMPDLRPTPAIRGSKGLLKAICREHALLAANTAERIMSLGAGVLEGELGEVLRRYPETDPKQKAVHFKLYERCRKWLFEGEDRNRFFMWQFSPFYSLSTLRLAMQIPDSVKEYGALYLEFQKQLNSTLTHLPDANNGLALDSAWLPVVLRVQRIGRRLPMSLKSGIRRLSRLRSIAVGRRSDGGKREGDGGRSVALRADSVMSAEETSRMLMSANDRQFQNWQTLALLEQLW
jgi:asparagine synthase (glutamine-hydrolysing)